MGTNLKYTFRRAEKLHRDKDFQRVLRSGRKLVHPAIFIYIRTENGQSDIARLGLITSRRVGNAVERNRLKRRLREIFRLNKHRMMPGADIIFLLRPAATALNYRQLEAIVLAQLKKGGIVRGEQL